MSEMMLMLFVQLFLSRVVTTDSVDQRERESDHWSGTGVNVLPTPGTSRVWFTNAVNSTLSL